jgi:hypothetical protein
MDLPPEKETPSKQTWWDDFKKPVNLIGWALAILGIGVGVFLYFKGKERRELSLRFVAVTKVYDSSSTSRKLSVLDSHNKRVTNDVYSVSYQLWNSGTLPIEPADIRRPFKMQLVGDARLLDWTVEYCVADPDVCGFHFDANDTNPSPSSVTLKWLHCDPQHGCQIQFLYAGTSDGALSFESPFSGNGEVIDANGVVRYRHALASKICATCFILSIVFLPGMEALEKRRKIKPRMKSVAKFLGYAMLMTSILSFIWIIVIERPLKTPFPSSIPINFKMPPESGS